MLSLIVISTGRPFWMPPLTLLSFTRFGVPTPTFPWTTAGDVVPLLIAVVGITLVSLTNTIATATSFAARGVRRWSPTRR